MSEDLRAHPCAMFPSVCVVASCGPGLHPVARSSSATTPSFSWYCFLRLTPPSSLHESIAPAGLRLHDHLSSTQWGSPSAPAPSQFDAATGQREWHWGGRARRLEAVTQRGWKKEFGSVVGSVEVKGGVVAVAEGAMAQGFLSLLVSPTPVSACMRVHSCLPA